MGIVFGSTGTKEPPFRRISLVYPSSASYEIREYGSIFIAELDKRSIDDNSAFRVLAAYIGVFGDPQNVKQGSVETIDMTAPVLMQQQQPVAHESIVMTSPVLMAQSPDVNAANIGNDAGYSVVTKDYSAAHDLHMMSFVLPEKYKTLSEIPVPKNAAITIRTIPPRFVAVKSFSGRYSNELVDTQRMELLQSLKKDGVISDDGSLVRWSLAQFHPPFTLPFMRRNEIWIDIDPEKLPKLSENEVK
jgi:hypothetical protein